MQRDQFAAARADVDAGVPRLPAYEVCERPVGRDGSGAWPRSMEPSFATRFGTAKST